jgi:ABC-type transport system involved in multi-copper enzyme maturation permease subunit
LKVKVLKLHSLWNDELGFIFPISEELMQRNTYNTLGFLEEHSYVALYENEPIGFVINKIWLHDYHIENNLNTGWISLIYVFGITLIILLIGRHIFKKREL